MKPIFSARKSVFSLSLRRDNRRPAIQTSPDVNSSIPERQFRRVVLPQPEGPMIATISPRRTSRFTPRRARTSRPPPSYTFTSFRATTIRSSGFEFEAFDGVASKGGVGGDVTSEAMEFLPVGAADASALYEAVVGPPSRRPRRLPRDEDRGPEPLDPRAAAERLDLAEPRVHEERAIRGLGHRAGDAPSPGARILTNGLGELAIGHDVGQHDPAPGSEDAVRLSDHLGLVRGQVHDAIGDDHVDALAFHGEVLDLSEPELRVPDPSRPREIPRGEDHLGRRVDADPPPVGSHAFRGREDVVPATAPEIEDDLPRCKVRERDGVPHAELLVRRWRAAEEVAWTAARPRARALRVAPRPPPRP